MKPCLFPTLLKRTAAMPCYSIIKTPFWAKKPAGRITENLSKKQQEHYERGCKTGLWRKWYADGSLKEKVYWKEGQLDGKIESYDAEGKMILQGTYKKGKRQGWFCSIKEGAWQKEKYKQGKLMPPKKVKKKVEKKAKPAKEKKEAGSEKKKKSAEKEATDSDKK